jgi:hypothetical protein
MNNERYLQVAKENGGHVTEINDSVVGLSFYTQAFLATCAAIEKEVREACAKLCEQTYETGFAAEPRLPCFDTAEECAEAIRGGVK